MAMETTSRALGRRRQALTRKAVRRLRDVQTADRGARVPIYREAAAALIDLRETYLTKEGTPDWRGVTYEYRQKVSEVYREAGLPDDPRAPVKASLRYHLNTLLRERLSEDDLEQAGLMTASQREASYDRYMESASLADAARRLLRALHRAPHRKPSSEDVMVAYKTIETLTSWLRTNGIDK